MTTKSPAPHAGHWGRKAFWCLAPVFAALPFSAVAQARDPSALQVRIWASSCMACHGPDGKAEGGYQLAGKSADDLLTKLLAYKSGKLQATVMHQHAKGYSDDELARIAAYFASIK